MSFLLSFSAEQTDRPKVRSDGKRHLIQGCIFLSILSVKVDLVGLLQAEEATELAPILISLPLGPIQMPKWL